MNLDWLETQNFMAECKTITGIFYSGNEFLEHKAFKNVLHRSDVFFFLIRFHWKKLFRTNWSECTSKTPKFTYWNFKTLIWYFFLFYKKLCEGLIFGKHGHNFPDRQALSRLVQDLIITTWKFQSKNYFVDQTESL